MSRWRSLLIRVLAYRVIACDAFGLILAEANLWRGKARSPRRTSGKPRLTWTGGRSSWGGTGGGQAQGRSGQAQGERIAPSVGFSGESGVTQGFGPWSCGVRL